MFLKWGQLLHMKIIAFIGWKKLKFVRTRSKLFPCFTYRLRTRAAVLLLRETLALPSRRCFEYWTWLSRMFGNSALHLTLPVVRKSGRRTWNKKILFFNWLHYAKNASMPVETLSKIAKTLYCILTWMSLLIL